MERINLQSGPRNLIMSEAVLPEAGYSYLSGSYIWSATMRPINCTSGKLIWPREDDSSKGIILDHSPGAGKAIYFVIDQSSHAR